MPLIGCASLRTVSGRGQCRNRFRHAEFQDERRLLGQPSPQGGSPGEGARGRCTPNPPNADVTPYSRRSSIVCQRLSAKVANTRTLNTACPSAGRSAPERDAGMIHRGRGSGAGRERRRHAGRSTTASPAWRVPCTPEMLIRTRACDWSDSEADAAKTPGRACPSRACRPSTGQETDPAPTRSAWRPAWTALGVPGAATPKRALRGFGQVGRRAAPRHDLDQRRNCGSRSATRRPRCRARHARRRQAHVRADCADPGKLSHAGALHPDRRRRDCTVRHRSLRRAADRAHGRSRRCVRGRVRPARARSTGRASARSRPR